MVSTSYTAAVPTPKTGLKAGKRKSAVSSYNWSSRTTPPNAAQFYAAKLGISLQHLSTTIKQVTGKNVLDLIAHVVIIDIKAKLKSTDMTIQEIAYSLNFPSASFFGKYFKRHLGMSPLEYRNS